MKKLTLKIAIYQNLTPIGCVKYYRPEWDNEKCEFFLWEKTCFPHCSESMIKQIHNKLSKDL